MPNIQSKHWMAVAETQREFSLNFSLRLNLKREFSNLLIHRRTRVSGLYLLLFVEREMLDRNNFSKMIKRVQNSRHRTTNERILREIDREILLKNDTTIILSTSYFRRAGKLQFRDSRRRRKGQLNDTLLCLLCQSNESRHVERDKLAD